MYRINSGEYSSADYMSDDEILSPGYMSKTAAVGGSKAETMSLSGTIRKGMKLAATEHGDVSSLSGTLKRGARNQGRSDSVQNLASPRNSKHFNFRSPKKSSKKRASDDTVSIRSYRDRQSRGYNLRVGDVLSPSPFDDTVSLMGNLLDSTSCRHEEGIRDVIGRKGTVTLKKMVKLERAQGDRVDAKVLVLTPYRCQIFGVTKPFKVEADFHFLDIKAMDSSSPQRLVISTHSSKIYFMQMIGSDDADHIIGRVTMSLRTIFPSVPLSRILKASLEPLSRQKIIQQMLNQADQAESGPCGNFSEMYRCVCDYLGCPVREEAEWDVDTIYLSQNCRLLHLRDFDLPDPRDIIPIVSVLNYNKWFEGLVVRGSKLHSDVFDFILKAVRNSANMKTLILEGVGVKGDFAQKLASCMIDNKECHMQHLDLSNNPLEDKGFMHLSGALPTLQHVSLERLNVARTGLTVKGINGLCQALRSGPSIMKTLTHLNLSGNYIKVEDAEGLYNFLSAENCITDLDLSCTEGLVEMYVSALAKGCTKHLQNVDLSRNNFQQGKKHKDSALPPSFLEFFRLTTALKSMNLSFTKIPPEAVKAMLDGLLGNMTKDLQVSLNLTSCELKAQGCIALQTSIASLSNVVGLDLTDNMLDAELPSLFGWIQQNHSLRELKIGRNFSGVKPKHMRQVMDCLVELVQEENSCLESLSIADSKLREFTHVLLGCLGSNTSLTSLDISGNNMGDSGARVLAKSLQINSKLRVLNLDRNALTAISFHELSLALERNFTLRYMPYPVNDCVAAMKQQPEKTQQSLTQIQDLLLRNTDTNKASNDQQFRLQRVVTSTAQQVLDKVAEKVDDLVNALEIIDADSSQNEHVISGKTLVKDAKNSKELLSDIYGLGMEKSSGVNSQLECKIDDMAASMDRMVEEHIKSTVEAMTKNAEAQCPHIYEEIKGELQSAVEAKQRLPSNCVRDHVIKTSGTEIVNKVSELNLSIATLISDKVTDTLLAALSQCNVSLTEQLNKQKDQQRVGSSSRRRQEDNDEESEIGNSNVTTDVDGMKRDAPEEGDLLPNMRKQRAASVAKRRQRPVTMDFDESKQPLGGLPPIPGQVPEVSRQFSRDDDAKKITDFGVEHSDADEGGEDLYANSKVKERKRMAKEASLADDNDEVSEQEKKDHVAEKQETENAYDSVKSGDEFEQSKKVDEIEEDMEQGEEVIDGMLDGAKPSKTRKTEDSSDAKKEAAPTLDDLPDVESQPKLDHVTKARPRATNRRGRRPHHVKRTEDSDLNVDDFFNNNVGNTDFSVTPSLAEEEELKEKEKKEELKEEKKASVRKMGGMAMGGMPMVTADMLKKKKPTTETRSSAPEEEEDTSSAKEEEHEEKSAVKARPKGAMVMPGMGFGGNLLAEMKLKKLSKKEGEDAKSAPAKGADVKNGDPAIGPGMLKKRNRPDAKPNQNENNNNNSRAGEGTTKSSLRKWGFGLHHKDKKDSEKSEKNEPEKKAVKTPLMPPSLAPKPAGGKGKPPPLPSKPKPAFLKPGGLRDTKVRPMSEFLETSPSDSLVRTRAASWGKSKSKASDAQDDK